MASIWHEILLPFIISTVSSFLVVLAGIKNLKAYIHDIEIKKDYGSLRDFWCIRDGNPEYNLIFGCELAKIKDLEPEPRVGYSQAFGISEITRLLDVIFDGRATAKSILLQKTDPFPAESFNTNTIIFGGELVLTRFRQFCLDLDIPYYQHDLDVKNRAITKKENGKVLESLHSAVDWVDQRIKHDVGTVTRIINPINGKLIILFNANYSAGLLGAILATTGKGILPKDGFDSKNEAQQLVIEVPNIINNLISRDHKVAPKNWTSFKIDASKVQKAIEKSTAKIANSNG